VEFLAEIPSLILAIAAQTADLGRADKELGRVTKKTESNWTGRAALAGAAIGSAAVAAALLYASRRKEREAKESAAAQSPVEPPETD